MGQRKQSTRPDRRTMQVRLEDYDSLKGIAGYLAPFCVELQTAIKAARLAFESLPDDRKTHFLKLAAAAESGAAAASFQSQ